MDYNRLLEGRRAFVTTGARGIGKAIALLFAKQGATVLVGGKNLSALEATVKALRKLSPDSKGYALNLSAALETEEVCDRILEDFGGVDILVNTVGVNSRAPAHAWEDETMARLLETNFLSGMRCARKFLPGMIERGFGSVVNISSIHSERTMPGNAIYAATKGAMNASARAMALDYARTGVRVNTICPGLIMSDALADEVESYPEGPERDAFLRLLDGMQPLKPGTSEDIANAALFLASDMSAYMTGQALFLDGGAGIKAHP
ncbi:MAG: SDR family oxidoreductase [Clostridiales bacterium]|nr:SDR family oxidoreductase [Clostridiales bacterium]